MKKTIHYNLFFFILCVVLAWGMNWPLLKLTLQYIPPFWMGAARMLIGSILLFLFLMMTGRPILSTLKHWPAIIIVGLLQMSLLVGFINLGLKYVDAGRAAILVYTTPLWVTPISVFFFKERLSIFTLLGLLVGLLGLIFLFNPFVFNWSDNDTLIGNGFLLLAAFSWALAIIYVHYGHPNADPLDLAPWQMLFATLFLSLLALIVEPHTVINWSWHLWPLMLYMGLIATAFGFWGVIEMAHRLSPITCTLSMLGAPVIGVISSSIVLREPLNMNHVAALILLLLGLIFVALGKTKQPSFENVAVMKIIAEHQKNKSFRFRR